MHQAIFADVEVARACAAAPLVLSAICDVVLKRIEHSIAAAAQLLGFEIDRALLRAERLKLTVAIVNNANRRSEAQFNGPPAYCQRVLWIADAASHHGVDVHVELGVFSQQL